MIHYLYLFPPSVVCPEWYHSGSLAIWLPGGFNQWQTQTGVWRIGGDEGVFIPCAMLPSCLDTGGTVTVFCCDLGPHQTTFPPHLQLPSCFGDVMLSSCFLRLRVAMASCCCCFQRLYLVGFFKPAPLL